MKSMQGKYKILVSLDPNQDRVNLCTDSGTPISRTQVTRVLLYLSFYNPILFLPVTLIYFIATSQGRIQDFF